MSQLQTVLDALISLANAHFPDERSILTDDDVKAANEAIAIVQQMMHAEPVGYVFSGHGLDYIGCVISGTPNNDYVPIYAAPQAVPAVCEWTQDPDFEMGDTYHSSCGELWSFIDGGPKENRVSYCHHCGKPVKLASAPKGAV